LSHPRADLVAVQKRDMEAAHRVAGDFGVPHACTRAEELVAVDGLDAVIVSSTPNMHYPHTKAALERGCHVLVEKPMAITVSEAAELLTLAEERGLHLLISCPWHYTSHGIEARRLIRQGVLGEVKMLSVLMTNFSGPLYRGLPLAQPSQDDAALEASPEFYLEPGPESYSDPSVAGGGQIYCQVSHAAAHIAFLTGSDPAEVFARFDNDGAAVDMHDTLNIKLRNGALVSLASTGATMTSGRTYEVRIYGTEGMLFMELWKGTMVLHERDGQVRSYPELQPEDIYPMYAPTTNLVDVVLGLAENGSPARLGVSAMRVIEAACQSACSGQNIIV
jgi:predicted dehydrogenase